MFHVERNDAPDLKNAWIIFELMKNIFDMYVFPNEFVMPESDGKYIQTKRERKLITTYHIHVLYNSVSQVTATLYDFLVYSI